jgi:BirA family biotin operon repressor/biotin-[acetyl-CoA-carboxylase] ligase
VGINVNQPSFTGEMEETAVSLYQLTGKTEDRISLLCRLLDLIEENLSRFKKEGFAPFREDVEERLIFKGEEVIVHSDRPIVGILKGIDREGYLLLQTADGERRITAGDVSLRLYR